MSRSFLPIPAFDQVTAGQTSRVKLERNRRVHGIVLNYKDTASQATMQNDLTQFRLTVNAKVVRTFSATELFLINAENGLAVTAGRVVIPFSEPRRRTPEGEEFGALNAFEELGVGDVGLEVDIAAGVTAPTLTGKHLFDFQQPNTVWYERNNPKGNPRDIIASRWARSFMHWRRLSVPCAAAFTAAAPLTPSGFLPFVPTAALAAGYDAFLHRIHAFDAVVTQMLLRSGGGRPFWNANESDLAAVANMHGMAKQAATFSALIDSTQQLSDGVSLGAMPDLGVDFVTSGAATGNQISTIAEIRKLLDAA